MNNPTEPALKDATDPASTFSEGNSEGDYEKKKKVNTKCRTWEKPASCINATCFQWSWSELRGRNGAACQGDVRKMWRVHRHAAALLMWPECTQTRAKWAGLGGQKKHKDAVLFWVCGSAPGTGSVTGEEKHRTKPRQDDRTFSWMFFIH